MITTIDLMDSNHHLKITISQLYLNKLIKQ